jgi:BolA protein
LAKPFYIGEMEGEFTGPVAAEIHQRLTAALQPTRLVVRDDSEKHRGHGGYRGEGAESHFTVEVEAAAFAGQSRLARQRAVNAALAELLVERVHALAIVARAPGES